MILVASRVGPRLRGATPTERAGPLPGDELVSAPTLVATNDEELGLVAKALFDSDRDGGLELITGHGRFDHGMSLETSYVAYRDLGARPAADAGPVTDVDFSTYFGCD